MQEFVLSGPLNRTQFRREDPMGRTDGRFINRLWIQILQLGQRSCVHIVQRLPQL